MSYLMSKKEYYVQLDLFINNYIVNKVGISEIKSLLKKLIRLNLISDYKLNQSLKLIDLKKTDLL